MTKKFCTAAMFALGFAILILPVQALSACIGYAGPGGPCSTGRREAYYRPWRRSLDRAGVRAINRPWWRSLDRAGRRLVQLALAEVYLLALVAASRPGRVAGYQMALILGALSLLHTATTKLLRLNSSAV